MQKKSLRTKEALESKYHYIQSFAEAVCKAEVSINNSVSAQNFLTNIPRLVPNTE